jgi:hypothetical protein
MPTLPSSTVADILREKGPLLPSDLVRELVRRGLSASAARQRLSRAVEPVRRFDQLTLPHNQQILYHEAHFRSERYWEGIYNALVQSGSVYGIALGSLEARGGIVPSRWFDIISGSPFRLSNHLGWDVVQHNLEATGLVIREIIPGLGEALALSPRVPLRRNPISLVKARHVAEDLLLIAARDWLRKNGFVSYDRVEIRSDDASPSYANLGWDLVGPSYLLPLFSKSASTIKPGFVVLDALIDDNLQPSHVRYFIHKCKLAHNQRRSRPFVPILLANGFTREAFDLGRRHGLVFSTPANFLGDELAAALSALVRALANAAAVAATNPELVSDLYSKLSKIEGAAGNLRGALFEMVVGHCVRAREGNTIDIGKQIVTPDGDRAEIDVLRVKEDQEVAIYECKGHAPSHTISVGTIRTWLMETVPRIRRWLLGEERFRRCSVEFSYWTTGHFEDAALTMLQEASEATRKYKITWRTGKEVREYAKLVGSPHILKILDEHYTAHPLTVQVTRASRNPERGIGGPTPVMEPLAPNIEASF